MVTHEPYHPLNSVSSGRSDTVLTDSVRPLDVVHFVQEMLQRKFYKECILQSIFLYFSHVHLNCNVFVYTGARGVHFQ